MAKESLVKRHKTHKYQLVKQESGREIYRCMMPGCRHFIPVDMIENQVSVCHKCEEEFVVRKHLLFPRRVVKLHCNECKRPVFNRATGKVQKGPVAVAPVPVAPEKPEVTLDFVDELLRDIMK